MATRVCMNALSGERHAEVAPMRAAALHGRSEGLFGYIHNFDELVDDVVRCAAVLIVAR